MRSGSPQIGTSQALILACAAHVRERGKPALHPDSLASIMVTQLLRTCNLDKGETNMSEQAEIVKLSGHELAGTDGRNEAIAAWADATTDASSRRRKDLRRDKSRAVLDFFAFSGKSPEQVRPRDVKAWQAELERRELSPATVYAMISRVSSFYTWARKIGGLGGALPINPVNGARPKAPKAYQSESIKALADDELDELISFVKAKADSGSTVGKRDYALLLHYVLTGRRRQEVIGLRWGDIRKNGTMIVSYRVKGGKYEVREVQSELVKAAMMEYLEASDRLESMVEDSPIWTRHDRAGKPGGPLTSHAFDKNLKRYAQATGLPDFHLHQLRHTFATQAADETGSLTDVQEALGHENLSTTRVYVQRVGVRRDRLSERLAERLGLE